MKNKSNSLPLKNISHFFHFEFFLAFPIMNQLYPLLLLLVIVACQSDTKTVDAEILLIISLSLPPNYYTGATHPNGSGIFFFSQIKEVLQNIGNQ